MALDRKCIVCPDKHHYKYCNNCGGYNSLETWRFIFCSENCKEIYKIASDFVNGELTGIEAKKELEKYDISDLEFYHPIIKQNIADILASEVKISKNAIKEEDAVVLTVALDEHKVEEGKNTTVSSYSNNTKNNSCQNNKRNNHKNNYKK